jgi:site-specific recombinase XerD
MPSIFKRSNGIYYFLSDEEKGKRRWKTTGETRKSLALKKILWMHNGLDEKSPDESKSHTPKISLKKFIAEFIYYAQSIYAQGTVDIYEKSLDKFRTLVGDIPLTQVSERHIDLYKVSRLKNISPVTVNLELRTLRAAFYKALKWKLISENPFKCVSLCKIDEQVPAYLCYHDFKTLLSKISEKWFRDIILVAAMTGMRRGEILNLVWSDVDLKNKVILIQSHHKLRTKCGKKRIIPMNNDIYSLLVSLTETKKSEYVFSIGGEKISGRLVTMRFKRYICKFKLNTRLHFHSLRHTFASWLVQEGASIYEVQKLLGHSNISVTQIYSHLAPNQLHNAVNKINVSLN